MRSSCLRVRELRHVSRTPSRGGWDSPLQRKRIASLPEAPAAQSHRHKSKILHGLVNQREKARPRCGKNGRNVWHPCSAASTNCPGIAMEASLRGTKFCSLPYYGAVGCAIVGEHKVETCLDWCPRSKSGRLCCALRQPA